MLPAPFRLRDSDAFRVVVRRGVRAGRDTLVVHTVKSQGPPSRAGFVVSKAVGNAVTRNRVKRQLRHLAAAALPQAPFAVDVVVRALPPAATRGVRDDFTSAFAATLRKLEAA